jgi:hypothetical protein
MRREGGELALREDGWTHDLVSNAVLAGAAAASYYESCGIVGVEVACIEWAVEGHFRRWYDGRHAGFLVLFLSAEKISSAMGKGDKEGKEAR